MNDLYEVALDEIEHQAESLAIGKRLLHSANDGIFGLNRSSAESDVRLHAIETGGIAVALTIYNEHAEALAASLAAIASNVEYLKQATSGATPLITLCLIVDGADTIADSTLQALEAFGLPASKVPLRDSDLLVCHRNVGTAELQTQIRVNGDYETDCDRWSSIYRYSMQLSDVTIDGSSASNYCQDVQLLICLKTKNSGKLDSHWWFYEVFCTTIQPLYCFQMDVGTVPVADAMWRIYERFERDGSIGGLASCVHQAPPMSALNILQVWQFQSFAKCVLLDWPAEVASGYLSVIPGQFSAVRWNAVRSNDLEAGPSPLDVYFRGLGALGPYETSLYLAEDRVLCSEIVTRADKSWHLGYEADAVAITDTCHTWTELLKQRKRWCSGYLSCRQNFISKVPRFLADPNKGRASKIRMVGAAIYHGLRALLDWLVPAILITAYYDLAKTALESSNAGSKEYLFITCSSGLVCGAIAMQLFVSLRGTLDKLATTILFFSSSVQVAFILSFSFLYMNAKGHVVDVLSVVVIASVVPILSMISGRVGALDLVRSTFQFLVVNPVVNLMLWMYAICNMHDNSWGTKGLDKPTYSAVKSEQKVNLDEQEHKESFRRFRFILVFAWIITNLAAGVSLYRIAAFLSYGFVNIALIAAAFILSASALPAFARAMNPWKSKTAGTSI